MHRIIKYRYLFCLRLDSQYVLKLLILFNVFLGLYLLFLSTNYHKYGGYTITRSNVHDLSAKQQFPRISEKKVDSQLNLPPPVAQQLANGANLKLSQLKSQVVEKVYDSNNKLVVVQDNNAPDSSFKHVEEDDKTLDENDKLRLDMIDKSASQNSIIHDVDFSNNHSHANSSKPSNKDANELNGEVIDSILDHNLHLQRNKTKLIVPDVITADNTLWSMETRGRYTVYKDYVPANLALPSNGLSVTLTTQGTHDFLHHSIELCDRWEGYISLAVYAPGDDFRLALNIIYYLRQCSNRCVADRIHWHLVFESIYAPRNASAATAFLETQNFDCGVPLEQTIRLLNLDSNFRATKGLPYPINVLRNVARINAKTKYVFASDIELYPSVGIVPAFFKLLEREKAGQIGLINKSNPHVYVTPIFEVKQTVKAPRTKAELVQLFRKKDAIFFHRYVCDLCQNFPDRDAWLNATTQASTSLDVFRVTRRNRDRNQWEPLYIGTNDEPFYDERLTWDGKRDKMSQMYEMCLRKYDLLILDNAFLVHAPGIKYYHPKDDNKRMVFMRQNYKVYNQIMANLRHKFGVNNDC